MIALSVYVATVVGLVAAAAVALHLMARDLDRLEVEVDELLAHIDEERRRRRKAEASLSHHQYGSARLVRPTRGGGR